MLVEISVLEAYQVQAALEDRLAKLGEDPTEADSLESAMVKQGLTYTGSVHAKLLVLLYGEDEPDEPAWEYRDPSVDYRVYEGDDQREIRGY